MTKNLVTGEFNLRFKKIIIYYKTLKSTYIYYKDYNLYYILTMQWFCEASVSYITKYTKLSYLIITAD